MNALVRAAIAGLLALIAWLPFGAPGGLQARVEGSCGDAAQAASPEREGASLRAFERRVADYVGLHRRLEGPLPPMQTSRDLDVVRAAMDALARAIRNARRDARQGDIFTPEVAPVFRRLTAACLTPEDIEAIMAERETEDPAPPPRLAANMAWPEGSTYGFVPPHLLETLPALPPELQYRIIGRSLVLWDHHANLIVDFLPGALPGAIVT